MFGQAGMHSLFSLLIESSISSGLNKDSNFCGSGHGMAVGFGGCWASVLGLKSSHHLSSQQLIFSLPGITCAYHFTHYCWAGEGIGSASLEVLEKRLDSFWS